MDVQRLYQRSGDFHRASLTVERCAPPSHALTEPPTPLAVGGIHYNHSGNGNSRSEQNTGSLHRDKSLRTFYSRIQQPLRTTNNNEPRVKEREISESKLVSLFEHYRDAEAPLYIMAEGVERLLGDLSLNPDDFKVLVLAWRLDAETMCQFSKDEFLTGLRILRADSLKNLTLRLTELSKEVLNNQELFKELYRFTFRFGLDKSVGQRILPSDMAVCLWRIVFTPRPPPILPRWLSYLAHSPHVRGIPRDTWNMFLPLAEALGEDLGGYDDAEAWPSLFDDFVEFETDQRNQNVSGKEGRDKELDKEVLRDC